MVNKNIKKNKKGEVSEVIIAIIIILIVIFIGMVIFYSKVDDFKSFLGL